MATTAADPVFVDTNILVFANVTSAPLNAKAQQALTNFVTAGAELWISRQILREYAATLTRPQPFTKPIPVSSVVAGLTRFQVDYRMAEDGAVVTANLMALLTSVTLGGKQVHDANIVATMQRYGIGKLLTHNAADFARFGHLITVIPL